MHITSMDVISLNGKITRGEDADAHTWSSPEDWERFKAMRQQHNLLVMGRGSYESVRPKPESDRLRVVLTHHPEKYAEVAIPGQLEFMNQSPEALLELLEGRGFTRMLLLGGEVNTQFFTRGLVDEMFVTIEPLLFGAGRHLLEGLSGDFQLRLASIEQLNERGTLLAHYLVDKTAALG